MIPSSLTDMIKQSTAYKQILARLINARSGSSAASQTAFPERRQVHLPGFPCSCSSRSWHTKITLYSIGSLVNGD
jgi:hypothetical protein